MPTASSADPPPTWPPRVRVWMLLWNLFPLVQVTTLVVLGCALRGAGAAAAVLGGLFLLPPLLCRLLLLWRTLPGGTHPIGSAEFLTWWASAQLQLLFCRLPMLEECLRLVPGLYSFWLRLWGARIGRLTFWAPGLRILDRSFLRMGDDVVTGAGVRLNAHVIDKVSGVPMLHVATIEIGDRCHIGGYSLLTAGCQVADDESVHAFALLPPFARWQAGRRAKIAHPTA